MLPSAGILSDVSWFKTDVSVLLVNLQGANCLILVDGTDRWPRNDGFKTTCVVITQKTEEFSTTTAEAYDYGIS